MARGNEKYSGCTQLEAGKIKELGVEIFSLLLKYYSHGLEVTSVCITVGECLRCCGQYLLEPQVTLPWHWHPSNIILSTWLLTTYDLTQAGEKCSGTWCRIYWKGFKLVECNAKPLLWNVKLVIIRFWLRTCQIWRLDACKSGVNVHMMQDMNTN